MRKPLAGAPPRGREYHVYSVVSPVEVAPHVDPAQFRQTGEMFGAHERGSGFIRQRSSRVEIANEQERFLDAGLRRRQQGIPEPRLGRAFGLLGAGNGGENVYDAEAKALLGQIDIQPANRVLRRRGRGAAAAQRSAREDADAVIDARRTTGDDVRPTVRAEGLCESHSGPRAEFGEGDNIGIVIGDRADDADIARTTAVLNVPGEKFHAPFGGRLRN